MYFGVGRLFPEWTVQKYSVEFKDEVAKNEVSAIKKGVKVEETGSGAKRLSMQGAATIVFTV